jgi:hypothetical protein
MKSLGDILLTALIAVLVGTLVSFLLVLLFDTTGSAVLATILIPLNILLPTLLGVCIHQYLKKSKLQWQKYSLFKQGFYLSVLFIGGLLLWAILEVLLGSGIDSSVFGNMKVTFVTQFLGFVPVAIATAFAIPVIDKRLNNKELA